MTRKKLDLYVEWAVDVALDLLESRWYHPLERVVSRLSTPAFLVALPAYCLAFALPPLVLGLTLLAPWAALVWGVAALVGAL